MPQTLASLLVHVIFSTKNRAPVIAPEFETRLFGYIGGILKECGARAHIVNGVSDHVPMLITLPPSVSPRT